MAGISLMATIVLASTGVFAANTITSNSTIKPDEFAVFVSNDGLYMSQLKGNNQVKLDEGVAEIKLPIISRDGLYVAYMKRDVLYVCNIKTSEKVEVAKDTESYDWDAKNELIYSTKNIGMSMYNTSTKKSTDIINIIILSVIVKIRYMRIRNMNILKEKI